MLFTCQLALINLVFGEIAQRLEHLPAAVAAVQRGLLVFLFALLPFLRREMPPLPHTAAVLAIVVAGGSPLCGTLGICGGGTGAQTHSGPLTRLYIFLWVTIKSLSLI